jgi:hypothetical protein
MNVPLSVHSMSSTPADAPEHCPGITSADAGKAGACEGCPNQQICATSSKAPDPDIELIRKRMSSIKKKVLCCELANAYFYCLWFMLPINCNNS